MLMAVQAHSRHSKLGVTITCAMLKQLVEKAFLLLIFNRANINVLFGEGMYVKNTFSSILGKC